MTDKEIKKALEYLPDRILTETERMAIENALDLINRQQSAIDVYMQENDRLKTAYIQVSEDRNEIRKEAEAEIERLSNSAKQWEDTAKDLLIGKEKQQAEIERLNVKLVGMRGACNSYKMHYDNAKAEIERLRENNKAIMQTIADVHTEAIKEFAEKLKDKASFIGLDGREKLDLVDTKTIDNLVKEMVGEE